jgi:hypothetical protein
LFIKYVSDKYAGVPYAPITIPPGASFKDMVALKGKSDIGELKGKFAGVLLSNISAARIEEYKQSRLTEGMEPATINHNLRVLKKALRQAESRNLIARSPFKGVELLTQGDPHEPHIVTFEEEEKILRVAVPPNSRPGHPDS